MKSLGLSILTIALLSACTSLAQDYQLSISLNDQELDWQELSHEEGILTIAFEGGKLELNLEDWGSFELAHIVAAAFTKSADNLYNVSATVRHNDTGWDNYADAFEVKGEQVENGLRVLLHPHENEQPFTRSQSNVKASGLVWLEAKDNLEGIPGSKLYLDLDVFKSLDSIRISYDLQNQ